MAFVHQIRVRYGEVDQQGVVFNAHYLAYADDAWTRWLATFGRPYTELGWDCMVGRAELEWQGSARFDEVLDIAADVARWGTTSFTLRFTMTVGDRPVCVVTIGYIGVALGTRVPTAMPDELRDALVAAAA